MKGLKLSNKQVEVLANEIYSELEKEANAYKESPEYINFEQTLKGDVTYKKLKKIESTLAELIKEDILSDNYYARQIMSEADKYVVTKRKEQFKTASIPSQTTIQNKIHLNTIDVDNLEDLISKVKESLTAKK